MNTQAEIRLLIEALHKQNVEFEKLLRVILRLTQDQEKDTIVNAFRDAIAKDAVEIEDCVVFGNLALQFDDDDRFIDLFIVVEGTTKRAGILIQEGLKS